MKEEGDWNNIKYLLYVVFEFIAILLWIWWGKYVPLRLAVLFWTSNQRYTYRVLQTIQMKLILLWVWAEQAILGRAKTALKFKYEIQIG